MFAYPPVPARRNGRRRDRHGRGLRGPLIPPGLPAARTRSQRFDETVSYAVIYLEQRLGQQMAGVEFAVEDVPPSNPAPWEHLSVPLGRYFPADLGMPHRIVVYRRPIEARADTDEDRFDLVVSILTEHLAHMLGRRPEEIDPDY